MDKPDFNNLDNDYYNLNGNDNNETYPGQYEMSIDSVKFVGYMLISIMIYISCSPLCKAMKHTYDDCFKLRSSLVTTEEEGNLLNECSICLERFVKGDKYIVINCGHLYHEKCIKEWIAKENTCPLCRENII